MIFPTYFCSANGKVERFIRKQGLKNNANRVYVLPANSSLHLIG